MTREEALRLAFQLVESMGADEKNGRGYKIDGWKPLTGPERADATVRFAEFLMKPDPPNRLVAPASAGSVFGATIFGWPLDGSRKPTEAEYLFALDARERIGPNGMVTAAEARALALLITAGEAEYKRHEVE